MAEVAGRNTVLKISGDAVAMTGEATTEDVTTKIYQITDTAKQVLDRTAYQGYTFKAQTKRQKTALQKPTSR